MLIWARSRDSLTSGAYRVLPRGDTVPAGGGAVVAARFVSGMNARGMTLDSGEVTLTQAAGRISARARGSGLDIAAGERVGLVASFNAVPLTTETASCEVAT